MEGTISGFERMDKWWTNGVEYRLNSLTIFFFGYLALAVFDGWMGTYPENILETGLSAYVLRLMIPAVGGVVFGWSVYSFCGVKHSFESIVYFPLLILLLFVMLNWGASAVPFVSYYLYFMWGHLIYLTGSSRVTL